MLAPFAPHVAEELWQRLGHEPSHLAPSLADVRPGQAGRIDDGIAGAGQRKTTRQDRRARRCYRGGYSARRDAAVKVQPWISGKSIKKQIYVPKKLVNLVVG